MRYIFLLLIIASGCKENNTANGRQNKELTTEAKYATSFEKRYYDSVNHIISSVFFNIENGEYTPTDSVLFFYNAQGTFKNVLKYEFSEGHYDKVDDMLEKEYYSKLFSSHTNCTKFSKLKLASLFPNELKDICNISNSVLPDGGYVKDLMKDSVNGNIEIIMYDNLNSKFTDLSLDLLSFFNNTILEKVELQIKDEYLLSELYFFENGELKRTYIYENERIKDILIEAKYKDGSIKKSSKNYFPSQVQNSKL